MKFGKQLQKRQLDIPEYSTSFVNYKALKKLIKQLSATPVLSAQNAAQEAVDPQTALQANRATFFFRLERELEKVNACYLQKEAELKLRLRTLLDKKRVTQAKAGGTSKLSASFISLEEGFQQFGNDLNKLQQFVEINATAFSKILKKWDKTSKSRTKELYLSRAVEVQPCFNRDVISDLSDQATTSLMELGAWAEGEKLDFSSHKVPDHTIAGQALGTEESNTDSQLLQAANQGNLVSLKEWVQKLASSPDATGRFTRTFLSASSEAPLESLEVLLSTDKVDIHAEDGINERNCLHEAAISGREAILQIGLDRGVDPSRVDVYGRLPIHYACMHGQVGMVRKLIAAAAGTINSIDHDNYTPLIHSIIHKRLACVQELLKSGARIDPKTDAEHAPLNLASQYGDIETCKLLLDRKAELVADAEGLYPQHLIARKGQDPQILLLLEQYGASMDQKDKLYGWTPLFHAASEGMVDCVRILLDKGVDVNILDEKDLPAMYYAAWEGHVECMKLLSSAKYAASPAAKARPATLSGAAHGSSDDMEMGPDGIPDLSLPPPIIPLRRYGHNFLDSKTFIQLAFDANGSESIKFYNDSKYPAARLTISSKSSDYIPRNVIIPIQEEFRTISFQVDNLDHFTVDFDIYPTFGSKIIARSVALPTIFRAIQSSSGRCALPLFDPRLRAIGRITFAFQVIKPFRGIPLEISQFETYWKATSQLDTSPSTLITGSSLSGEYVQLFVQLTRDGVAVLHPRLALDHHGIQCVIGRLSYEEFASFGKGSRDRVLQSLASKTTDDLPELHKVLAESFLSLKEVLAALPNCIHVALQVLYSTAAEDDKSGFRSPYSINDFADAVLTDVFDHARKLRAESTGFMRSVVFASHNTDICTALNWKQPNYPVLLCNDLDARLVDPAGRAVVESDGHGSMSLKEAVRVAQSNNFMGLVCSSTLLERVPALVESVKVAGLVLVSDTTAEGSGAGAGARDPPFSVQEGVDGLLRANGVLRFNETIDM